MKGRYAAAAMAASRVYAQGPPAYSQAAPSISYTTVTYDDCPASSMETMITITNGVTVTYCPDCEMHTTKPSGPGYTTTYTTTYMSLCPTGMVPKTYTVTESCTEPEPTWTPGPSHIPQGFTVTEKVCHVCDKTPTMVTMTEPCDCDAHEGTPAPIPAKPTGGSGPVTQLPDGQPQAPGGGSGGSGASTPCKGDHCDGSSNGSTPPSDGSGDSGYPPSGVDDGAAPCYGDDCGGSGTESALPSGGSGSGGSPPPCTGDDCAGSGSGGSPAPGSGAGGAAPSPTTQACVGPYCRAMVTGGGAPGVNYTTSDYSGMPSAPTEGMPPASGASLAVISSSIMAVVVAALALAL